LQALQYLTIRAASPATAIVLTKMSLAAMFMSIVAEVDGEILFDDVAVLAGM
jgi:hypothetical protein